MYIHIPFFHLQPLSSIKKSVTEKACVIQNGSIEVQKRCIKKVELLKKGKLENQSGVTGA